MPLFGGSRQLPATTYGYAPPPGASASGWQCNNKGCGAGDVPAPSKWPFSCPLCGGPADPDFDEPWREQARGPRLQLLIDQYGDEFGFYESAIRDWQYGQALGARDAARAEAIRVDNDRWLDEQKRLSANFDDSMCRGMMIGHALADGTLDGAARELTLWFDQADVYHLDVSELGSGSREGNKLRAKCFGLFRAAADFLDDPHGRSHPQAAVIDKAARYLGSATQHEMPVSLRSQWQALMRTPELG